MGANQLWDDVERLLIGKNIWIDTSLVTLSKLDRDQCRRMILNHDPDKILFGSDYPWCGESDTIEYLKSLELDAALMRRIYGDNALALLEG